MHVHCVCLCSHGHLVLVGGVHIQMDERVCAPATSAYHASVCLYAYAYTSMHVRILQVGPNSSGSNHLHCAGIEFWYGLRRTHARTRARTHARTHAELCMQSPSPRRWAKNLQICALRFCMSLFVTTRRMRCICLLLIRSLNVKGDSFAPVVARHRGGSGRCSGGGGNSSSGECGGAGG